MLDLSPCIQGGILGRDASHLIARAIRDSALADALDRVVLNDGYSPDLADLLERAGLAVDVVALS